MLNYFIEWTLKSAGNEKAIVHCSAGIGRTGTTISLMEQYHYIDLWQNVNNRNLSIYEPMDYSDKLHPINYIDMIFNHL